MEEPTMYTFDRCPTCGAPIMKNADEQTIYTCACIERDPCKCSDGCCTGMSICSCKDEE